MVDLGRSLRARARELALSDAEVARRAGLSERRYGNYVTGAREPDLATFFSICMVLQTTPNFLLGIGDFKRAPSERETLIERLVGAANMLEAPDLRLAVEQTELLARHRGGGARLARRVRRRRRV
jgi:transcriptional regulator with XRE-family HTH domain